MSLKKIGAKTIIITIVTTILIPVAFSFAGFIHKKVVANIERIAKLETSGTYQKNMIKDIHEDVNETRKDIKKILIRLK